MIMYYGLTFKSIPYLLMLVLMLLCVKEWRETIPSCFYRPRGSLVYNPRLVSYLTGFFWNGSLITDLTCSLMVSFFTEITYFHPNKFCSLNKRFWHNHCFQLISSVSIEINELCALKADPGLFIMLICILFNF